LKEDLRPTDGGECSEDLLQKVSSRGLHLTRCYPGFLSLSMVQVVKVSFGKIH
jgi:hypothetical protein